MKINGVLGVILAGILLGAIWLVSSYNSLINLQEDVNLAESDIEAAYQARIEKIPDLAATAQAGSDHEKAVYAELSQARAELAKCIESGDLAAMAEAEEEFTVKLNNFTALVEDNPEMQYGTLYSDLMVSIEGAANRILQARRSYNKVVNDYNRKIRTFPGSMYASWLGFEEIEEFKASEAAHQDSVVNFGK